MILAIHIRLHLVDGASERRYQLIEVKAPGDRRQNNQCRWLDFSGKHGILVAV